MEHVLLVVLTGLMFWMLFRHSKDYDKWLEDRIAFDRENMRLKALIGLSEDPSPIVACLTKHHQWHLANADAEISGAYVESALFDETFDILNRTTIH